MIRRLFGRRPQHGPAAPPSMPDGAPPTSEGAILAVLDKGCDDFVFPMLDNGYVYLAATRLSLYRSANDWAMAFEIFGFSPRGGVPDVSVWTFGSRIASRKGRAEYANQQAYDATLPRMPTTMPSSSTRSAASGRTRSGASGEPDRDVVDGPRATGRDPGSGDLRRTRHRAGRTRPRADVRALPLPGRRRAGGRAGDDERAPDPACRPSSTNSSSSTTGTIRTP